MKNSNHDDGFFRAHAFAPAIVLAIIFLGTVGPKVDTIFKILPILMH